MPSARPRTAPSALVADIATMHAWYALRDELLDRIDNVEDIASLIGRRVDGTEDRLEAINVTAQRAIDGNSTTVSEVRALISTSVGLENRFASFESELKALHNRDHVGVHDVARSIEKRAVARACDIAAKEQTAAMETIKGLLMDFRSELLAIGRNSESRADDVNAAQRRAEAAQHATRVQVAALETRLNSMSQELQMVHAQIGDTRVSLKEIETNAKMQLESLKHEIRETIRQDIAATNTALEAKIVAATGDALWRKIEARIDNLGQDLSHKMTSMADRMSHRCSSLEERQSTVVEGIESIGSRMGELKSVVEDNTTRIHRHHDSFAALKRDLEVVASTATGATEQLSRSLAELRLQTTSKHDELKHLLDAIVGQQQLRDAAVDERLKTVKNDVEEATGSLGAAFDQRLQILTNDVASVQRDFDSRHRKLVESTHQALDRLSITSSDAATVAALRQELSGLRETTQTHGSAIERWRVDATALAEIKDWLQDLERRAASKSELEQVGAALSSSISACRDAAHNSEAILAQRIEAERSAREYEATSLRSLLQRQQLSRGAASP